MAMHLYLLFFFDPRSAKHKNRELWLGGKKKHAGAYLWRNNHAMNVQYWALGFPVRYVSML